MAKRRRAETTGRSRSRRRSGDREEDVKTYLVHHDENVDTGKPGPDGSGTGRPLEPPPVPALSRAAGEVLAQALLLFSASSLRQYAGLVETVGRRVPDLARALQGETSESEGAEQLRGCLREIVEASIEEARRLRDQIDRLDRRTAPPAAEGEHWRRWKMKS